MPPGRSARRREALEAEAVAHPTGDYLWHGPYGTTYLVTDQATRRLP